MCSSPLGHRTMRDTTSLLLVMAGTGRPATYDGGQSAGVYTVQFLSSADDIFNPLV